MWARAWLGWTDGRARQAQAKPRAAARAAAGAWFTWFTSKAGQTEGLGRRTSRRPKSSKNRVRVSLVVRASDLRLNGREFDPRPPHYRSVGTGMGDRLPAVIGLPSRYVTSHPGEPSLLPTVGREMSTGQSAVMRCDCRELRHDGSFHACINVWVAGKTVWCLVNTCHSELFRGEFSRKGDILTSTSSSSSSSSTSWSRNRKVVKEFWRQAALQGADYSRGKGSVTPASREQCSRPAAIALMPLLIFFNRSDNPGKLRPSPWGSGPPSNTWFLGPTRVIHPREISICLAVFAGFTNVTNRLTVTDRQTDRPRNSVCRNKPHAAMRPNSKNTTENKIRRSDKPKYVPSPRRRGQTDSENWNQKTVWHAWKWFVKQVRYKPSVLLVRFIYWSIRFLTLITHCAWSVFRSMGLLSDWIYL